MRRPPVALTICSALAFACSPAIAQDGDPPAEAAPADRLPAPRITLDRTLHDFGPILDEDRVETRFTFVNEGDATLRILGVAPSCKCTTGAVLEDEVAPGDRGTLVVTFNPEGREGPQAQFVTLTTNDPDRPTVRLDVRAEVRKLVFALPRAAGFGTVEKDHVAETTVHVAGRTEDFRVLEAIADNPDLIRVEVGETDLHEFEGEPEPLRRTALKVRLLKGAPIGLVRQFFTVRTNDPRRETLRIDAVATVMGDIEVNPSRLQLGSVVVGDSVEREIVVRSRSGTPFTIRDVTKTTADPDACLVTVTPQPNPEGGRPSAYTVTLRITMPEHARAVRGHLTITTDVDREWTKIVIYGASPRRRHATSDAPAPDRREEP